MTKRQRHRGCSACGLTRRLAALDLRHARRFSPPGPQSRALCGRCNRPRRSSLCCWRATPHTDPPQSSRSPRRKPQAARCDIIDAVSGRRPAPITVYRALEFLIAHGLVHRIASRNAFLACVNNHRTGALVAFLICERCGAVGEAPGAAVGQSLTAAARSAGFTPKTSVVEITGLCAHCRGRVASTA
jgi:Fe2+ or Zn2+ uptake regulation protein